MNDQEKQKPKHTAAAKQMLVRYGRMGHLGWFSHDEAHLPRANTHVMIKTERGLEMGEVVGPWCHRSGVFCKKREQVEEYYAGAPKGFPLGGDGQFVRYATPQDIDEERHINQNAVRELQKCRELIKELNLPMKLIDVEHVFGGERVIFYFTAEDRVDFRELVKSLAREFQTRIEMRQVGSRDAARISADYETCGQQCCCARFMKVLLPVNMRMAKLQKATLDPSKISGYCGRLKCCLRYEDIAYRELVRNLPRKRTRVRTTSGEGLVVDAHVLTQLVQVRLDDGSIVAAPVSEIEILEQPPQSAQQTQQLDRAETYESDDYPSDRAVSDLSADTDVFPQEHTAPDSSVDTNIPAEDDSRNIDAEQQDLPPKDLEQQ